MTETKIDWTQANQRYLTAALAVVREALERHLADDVDAPPASTSTSEQELAAATAAMPQPPALQTLSEMFGLSPFERDVLLTCAGIELESSFTALCARAHGGDPQRAYPTFSLALAALPDAHWSALNPAAPLRRWRLIEVAGGPSLTSSQLRIDERILHYLAGVQHLDERLMGLIEPLQAFPDLVPSHEAIADRIAELWTKSTGPSMMPAVQLYGTEHGGMRSIARTACEKLGLGVRVLSAAAVPTAPAELDGLIRLWEREAALSGCALFVDCEDWDSPDPAREYALARFIDATRGVLIVAGRDRRRQRQRPLYAFAVGKPTAREQRAVWHRLLGPAAESLNGQVEAVISQFNLGLEAIHVAVRSGLEGNSRDEDTTVDGKSLWNACRRQTTPRLGELAQRIEPKATWDDLVLPDPQREALREIAVHVRQRMKVYDTWGFASKSSRGLGISALFSGASGTGKTMAAEVLANELGLDLYRIDLATIVSKYIGETEKNLRQVFDAAEDGGAILLFDEADALFGKRSEVKDSHDRYANIEISYLLQRVDAYQGLAILTSNMKNALDHAFLRRLRFIVEFPFPDPAHRTEIWRRIFPAETPTEGLEVDKLARLNVAGGSIRNIAMSSAFRAAYEGSPIQMRHVLRSARGEYEKLEKPLSQGETRQ